MTDTRLKSLIERIERLIEERQGIAGDIRDIFTEAKSAGYVPKAMRKVIARRAMNASDLAEEDALIEAYEAAAGAAGVAAKMMASGATIDEASAATGVKRSTAGFLKAPRKIQESQKLDEPKTAASDQPGNSSERGGEGSSSGAAVAENHESCGGGESVSDDAAETRKDGNMPGSVPGEETSSPPSVLVGAAELGGHHKHRAGVAPGPQDPIDLAAEHPPFLKGSSAGNRRAA